MKRIACVALIAGALGAARAEEPPPAPPPAAAPMVAPRTMGQAGEQANITYMILMTRDDVLPLDERQRETIQGLWDAAAPDRRKRFEAIAKARQELTALAAAETPDMARIEPIVRRVERLRGDDALADIRLNAAMKAALNPRQRERLAGLAPNYPVSSARR